ncbi:MAG: hypothetical protein A2283_08750 [Lentisphaerae bacterium RIFOXYA12_FULL_48_11]|nr:MAG: hypothetical protein A2283_08750 [Lentisphaerae bacterium RIFOXYA12_FULL_48_11]
MYCLSSIAAECRQPNIIFILTDDLGYGDLGCQGAKDINTPNLDRMAVEGMRFTDFSVVAPLCTPSRAAFMTGRYPGRYGLATGVLRPDAKNGLPPEEVTIAEMLKTKGYVTGCIGKWHLGFLPGMLPCEQGFDSYYGVLHNLDKHETVYFEKDGGMPILRGNVVEKRPAVPCEITGLYTAEALKFIEVNRDRPFFLYLAHAMPHIPFDASPRFKGKSNRGLYGDAVEELDDSAGQILEKLRSLDLAGRTLVIFTSDNGPERNTPGTAVPLRGTKHTVYEGGLRVPFIVWWPGRVPSGQVCSDFVTALDLFPTIAVVTGVELPAGRQLDGYDFSPVLLGEAGARSRRNNLYSFYGLNQNQKEALRHSRWKLHLGAKSELYDLETDICESENVAAQHADVVNRLEKMVRLFHERSNDYSIFFIDFLARNR